MADHLAWPFRVAPGGGLAVVVEDTPFELRQNVLVLLHTPRGARALAPDVGVDDPTFHGVDPVALAADLMDFEPRADVAVTVEPGGWEGEQRATITVHRKGL